MLGRKAAALTGARLAAPMAGPVIAGIVATGTGWVLARSLPQTIPVGVGAAAIAGAVYVLVLILIPGNKLLQTLRTMRLAVAAAT